MGKVGAKKKTDMKEMVAQALVSAIPVLEPVDPNSLRGHESSIVRSGLTEIICTYVFSGLSNVAIGRKTGIGVDTIDRFLRTPYFQHVYASKRDGLLGAVDEMQRERIQEILMQAIEKKYSIMIDPSTSRGLADKIATDFITMGERVLRTGKGRMSDALDAIFEQTLKKRSQNGVETTATVRIKGSPEEVAAAARRVQDADEPEGGGEGARADAEAGSVRGEPGTAEDEGAPVAPWDRPADSGSRALPATTEGSTAVEGSVSPAGGVREGE